LCAILNANLAGTGLIPYKVFAEATVGRAMEHVATALEGSGGRRYPAIALSSTDEHWVVVHGLTETASALTIHIPSQRSTPRAIGS
jgi:hypothetical protein